MPTALTLKDFRGYKLPSVPPTWTQEGDEIVCRPVKGSGVDLITLKQYADFELSLEWNLAPGGNSGIMFRVSEDKRESFETGPEFQILDDAAHAGLNDVQYTGALYDLYAPSSAAARACGEWNTTTLRLKGGRGLFTLNGITVVTFDMSSPDFAARIAKSKFATWDRFAQNPRGHLCLQDHGSVVKYRKIRITEL